MEKSPCIICTESIPRLVQSTKKDVSEAGGSRDAPLPRDTMAAAVLQACLCGGKGVGRSQCPQTFPGGKLYSHGIGGGKFHGCNFSLFKELHLF